MARKKRRGSKSGGFGSMIASGLTLILIIGGVMAWANVNNIKGVDDVYAYFRALSDKAWECGAGEAEWNCEVNAGTGGGTGFNGSSGSGGSSGGSDKGDAGNGKDKDNSDKDKPSSGSGTSDSRSVALDTLDKLKVEEAQSVAYDRAQWKHWTGSPCNTRMEVLKRDGKDVKTDAKCKVTSGTWVDVYSNDTFTEAGKLDIDHLIPLGYAAKHGGQSWDKSKKEEFANDMSHLLAVSAKENRSKSDKGPGKYMPPNKAYHCEYAKIWVSTSSKYGLSIDKSDRVALTAALQKCSA